MIDEMSPNPFWSQAMSEFDKEQSIRAFERTVYPVWKGLEVKDLAARNADGAKFDSDQADIALLHRQDKAIIASGAKPIMNTMTPESADKWRKKAAAGEKFAGWKG